MKNERVKNCEGWGGGMQGRFFALLTLVPFDANEEFFVVSSTAVWRNGEGGRKRN